MAQGMILTHTFRALKLYIPTFTDRYMILDIVYYLVADTLKSPRVCRGLPPFSYNTLYEYLDAVLEYDDLYLTTEIADKLYQLADQLLKSELFAYLDGYDDEILDVQYRHVYGEKFVKFFIYIGEVGKRVSFLTED